MPEEDRIREDHPWPSRRPGVKYRQLRQRLQDDPDLAEKRRKYYQAYRKKNRSKIQRIARKKNLRKKYQLTPELWEAILAAQDFRCYICGFELDEQKLTRTDHDHETGVVRGILCIRCNNAMGVLDTHFKRILAYRQRDAVAELRELLQLEEDPGGQD